MCGRMVGGVIMLCVFALTGCGDDLGSQEDLPCNPVGYTQQCVVLGNVPVRRWCDGLRVRELRCAEGNNQGNACEIIAGEAHCTLNLPCSTPGEEFTLCGDGSCTVYLCEDLDPSSESILRYTPLRPK